MKWSALLIDTQIHFAEPEHFHILILRLIFDKYIEVCDPGLVFERRYAKVVWRVPETLWLDKRLILCSS